MLDKRNIGVHYELSNHLGNVLATVSDYKSVVSTGVGLHYEAVVLTATDYDPFGMVMNHRTFNGDGYSKGFNGMLKDDEIYGNDNAYDFGARICDVRIGGRFFSLDPEAKQFVSESNYSFAGNSPIFYIDEEGKRKTKYTITFDLRTGLTYFKRVMTKGLDRVRRTVVINHSDYYKYDWYHTIKWEFKFIDKAGRTTDIESINQKVYYGTTNIGIEALILDPLPKKPNKEPKKEGNVPAGISFTSSDPQFGGDSELNKGADHVYAITNIDDLMALFGVQGGAPRATLGFDFKDMVQVADFALEVAGTADKVIEINKLKEKISVGNKAIAGKTKVDEPMKKDTFQCDIPYGCGGLESGDKHFGVPKDRKIEEYPKKK